MAVNLVLVGGFAGSGKTYVSKLLSSVTGYCVLDKDTVTRLFAEALLRNEEESDGPDDRHTKLYLEKVRPLEYTCLMKAVMENISLGVSCIANAPFIREFSTDAWIQGLQDECEFAGGGTNVHFVWVKSPLDTARKRMIERDASRDKWKLGNWEGYTAGFDNDFVPEVVGFTLENDGKSSVREKLELLENQLAED
jgi:predicted kinase